MYASLTKTLLPLSLLSSTLAGVIRIRGDDEDNSSSDPKKHHNDNNKDHNDNDNNSNPVSPEFIGCVSRTFFNLVSSDDNFDGDFSEQPDLQTCISYCVDDKFRYTYWDANKKQCYCSPAQRPDAAQIRDNDVKTGRCKNRDAIVFLNNATFKFGGCFDPPSGNVSSYGVTPVARFSTTSVRDCFVHCDEPCRNQFIDVVGITPRFDPALYSFAYDCECFDIDLSKTYPLINRTCAIDSVFGYARGEPNDDDHHKKEAKRGEYDDEDWYGKKYHHEQGADHDHKDNDDDSEDYDEEYNDKDHHEHELIKGGDLTHEYPPQEEESKKHHGGKYEANDDNDYDHGKDDEGDDGALLEDAEYDGKHHDDDNGKDHENDGKDHEGDGKNHENDGKNHEDDSNEDKQDYGKWHDHDNDNNDDNDKCEDHNKNEVNDGEDDYDDLEMHGNKKHHEGKSGGNKKAHDYQGDEYESDYGYYRRGR
ncbi:uncharacterized protein I206_100320 [Kwoniella pini CBS 10737]|uniref:Apple domain-containing protein n=1 Tax=Kwoniella pini CBS 10737 TaxID=1296096 RepID=A0A1B9IDK0_9TREE|nr:uncharacterized protein I206_01005 [Kwoniella pini CBS 10737]OCF53699.1 hypothetical protein I206_01005 [Kwoniella pini CBS 10737]